MDTKKPAKPYPDYPLFYHQTGQWAKKVRGKMHYFGKEPEAALALWLKEKDGIHARHTPRLHPTSLTIRELSNRFLASKKALVDTGELSRRTWSDYYTTCRGLVGHLGANRPVDGLSGPDFEKLRTSFAKRLGPVSLGNEIQRVRTILKFAWDEGLLVAPVRFGSTFKKPSRNMMRKAKNAAGEKIIEADDLRKLLAAAGVPLRAMILLGINCAFGQSDVAAMPRSALDLDGGWIVFPRVKAAIVRRIPLWPETVDALRAAIADRPGPRNREDAGLVFITKYGKPWVRMKAKHDVEGREKAGVVSDAIRLEFGKLVTALGLKRLGLGFYALRHTFATIAARAEKPSAVDHIMGHVDPSMGANNRQCIDDDRLLAVVQVVRDWLFSDNTK